jgi:anti-sigma factor RsiW
VTVTCAQAAPLLSAYFDRELDVTKSVEVEGHVRECSGCAAALQQYDALRSSVGAASLMFAPPKDLEWRVRKAVRREARPRGVSMLPPWRWAAVPLAATLAAAFSWSVAINRNGTSGDDPVLAELVSGHVRSLMADHLVDVATSDQHTVKPWFNGKVDFAPPVADFKASGFPLIGGRVDYVAGRSAAVLVYKRNQHTVNVFIWPAGKGESQPLRTATFQGYHLLRWSGSGLTFWAVSDVNSTDIESLARLFQEAG